LLRERIFGIALGYEDANDMDTLSHDPALCVACGKRLCAEDRLVSQPTLRTAWTAKTCTQWRWSWRAMSLTGCPQQHSEWF
ncbi:MAG TPA: transposase, partial [Chthonomonadales bacterium]|nr:transposase [Chthonomonadales bacterium]